MDRSTGRPPDIADPAWPCYWPSHGAKSSPARIGERTLVPRLLSPLALACDLGELEVCKWLHARGADVRKSGARNGITPMIIACERGHLDVCQWLYEVGAAADIRKCENFGFTPMMWACQAGQLSVCKWLFEMGAAADVTGRSMEALPRCALPASAATCLSASGCSR